MPFLAIFVFLTHWMTTKHAHASKMSSPPPIHQALSSGTKISHVARKMSESLKNTQTDRQIDRQTLVSIIIFNNLRFLTNFTFLDPHTDRMVGPTR